MIELVLWGLLVASPFIALVAVRASTRRQIRAYRDSSMEDLELETEAWNEVEAELSDITPTPELERENPGYAGFRRAFKLQD